MPLSHSFSRILCHQPTTLVTIDTNVVDDLHRWLAPAGPPLFFTTAILLNQNLGLFSCSWPHAKQRVWMLQSISSSSCPNLETTHSLCLHSQCQQHGMSPATLWQSHLSVSVPCWNPVNKVQNHQPCRNSTLWKSTQATWKGYSEKGPVLF